VIKNFLRYRTSLGLAASLLLVALMLAARYGLLPATPWTQYIIPRTPVNVTAMPIGTMNKPIPIVRTGSIQSPTSVPIATEFSGQISEVYVTEGQPVKAGQPLVKLLGSAEPSTKSEIIVSNQSVGTNSQAQTNYDNALKEYNRDQQLYEKGAIPRRKVENDAARLQVLKESLAGNQETTHSSITGTTTATSGGFATISAPINGIVTGLSAVIDKAVQTGQQLMVLDSGEVQVVIAIEQNDLYLVHLGTPATIEVSGQALLGQVVTIYPELGINNIPAFRTHIKVTNDTGGLLKTGMSVTVHINTGKTATVLAIPATAIFNDNQGLHYIYLADNGKAIRQQISMGEPLGDFIEITATLPEQALVITSNVDNLSNGDPIVIVE